MVEEKEVKVKKWSVKTMVGLIFLFSSLFAVPVGNTLTLCGARLALLVLDRVSFCSFSSNESQRD